MSLRFRTLEDVDLAGKAVLVRLDLNVPMHSGKVTDRTRILRQLPTIEHLIAARARVIIIAHFDRPKGKFVPSMSLAPLVDALSHALGGREVKFGVDSVGTPAQDAVSRLAPGEVMLLENLRFHAEEEANDREFSRALASLADVYVNDAFSCSHRAHASVVGVTEFLPALAGRLMQEELHTLSAMFHAPKRPLAAMVGGSKVSTKLALLEHLIEKVDVLMIGGAMANTFLFAEGISVGASLVEPDLKDTALRILQKAHKRGCEILLPTDVVAAEALAPQAPGLVVSARAIPEHYKVLDIGPRTVAAWAAKLEECQSLVWNGPVGAFETSPFDVSTACLARSVAGLTRAGALKSIAGGGDTVAALTHAGVAEQLSYLSTAGGAFLEWLEGKELPGVAALIASAAAQSAPIAAKG